MKWLYLIPCAPFLLWWLWPTPPPAPQTASLYYVGVLIDGVKTESAFASYELALDAYPFLEDWTQGQWNHSVMDCQPECATDQITAMVNCLNRAMDDGVTCAVFHGSAEMPCGACCTCLETSGDGCNCNRFRGYVRHANDLSNGAVPHGANR